MEAGRVTWSGFAPALLATFLGAALAAVFAIPVGLFLDRQHRRKAASKDAQQAASILSESLRTNAERLAALGNTLSSKGDIVGELLGLELDAETWETVRPLVGEHLRVDLAARLARHFSEERWVQRAVDVLVRAAVDPDLARAIEHPSLPNDLRQVRGGDAQRGMQRAQLGVLGLRDELRTRANHLANDASQLRNQLDRTSNHSTPTKAENGSSTSERP
jgi:hypothetical protein